MSKRGTNIRALPVAAKSKGIRHKGGIISLLARAGWTITFTKETFTASAQIVTLDSREIDQLIELLYSHAMAKVLWPTSKPTITNPVSGRKRISTKK